MMSAQPETKKKSTDLSRRDLLRRSAVGGATLAGVSAGAIRLDHGPVQESEAIAPAVAAGGAAGTAAVGWALREYEVLGSDDPPEGETPESLENSVYNIARSRLSTNQSTITDNDNILDLGLKHTAYAEGKIDGIDALNEQKQQSEVVDDAIAASHEQFSTVLKNFFKTWNEAVNEFYTQIAALEDHPDTGIGSVFDVDDEGGDIDQSDSDTFVKGTDDRPSPTTYELPNGEEIDIERVAVSYRIDGGSGAGTSTQDYHPTNTGGSHHFGSTDGLMIEVNTSDASAFTYLRSGDWEDIVDLIETAKEDVDEGLETWVEEVYSQVQSGELDTGELLTPREQAELTAEDEGFPQTLADLQALNIPVDLEREAEIYLQDINATLWGQIGYTGEQSLETGEIDPDDKDGSIIRL